MKRHLSSILVWIAVAVGFPYVAAMQGQPNMYGPSIMADQAKGIAAAAVAEARKNQWTMAIAIVDTAGDLVYFERMDNTQIASMDIAVGKAKAAATYRRPTRVFMDVINKAPATATLPGVFASPGGVPIMADGKVIGAVGVSGVTGDQDEQCAKAGLGMK